MNSRHDAPELVLFNVHAYGTLLLELEGDTRGKAKTIIAFIPADGRFNSRANVIGTAVPQLAPPTPTGTATY